MTLSRRTELSRKVLASLSEAAETNAVKVGPSVDLVAAQDSKVDTSLGSDPIIECKREALAIKW